MSKYTRGIIAALENDTASEPMISNLPPVSVDQEVPPVAVPDETSIPDDSVWEEECYGIECGLDEVRTAVEGIVELQHIAGTLTHHLDRYNGMSPSAARITTIAVDTLYARMGIPRPKTMPSLEAFGSTQSRAVATQIALEGILNNIENAFKAVLNFFKDIPNRLKSAVKEWKDSYATHAEKNEKLGALMKSAKSDISPARHSFHNKTIGRAFAAPSQAVDAAHVQDYIHRTTQLFTLLDQFFGRIGKLNKMGNDVLKAARSKEGITLNSEVLTKYVEVFNKEGLELLDFINDKKTRKSIEGRFVDGVQLVVDATVETSEASGTEYVKHLYLNTRRDKTYPEAMITTPDSASELNNVYAAKVALGKTIVANLNMDQKVSGYSIILTEMSGLLDFIVQHAERVRGDKTRGVSPEQEKSFNVAQDLMDSVRFFLPRFNGFFVQVFLNTLKLTLRTDEAATDYLLASISEYQKPQAHS